MSEQSRQVRIRIKSVRFEVEASLFSEGDEAPRIQAGGDPEPETIEINSMGVFTEKDGRAELSYDETEVTGMEGSRTAVSFATAQEAIVSMIREGMVSTVLVFEEGKRHHCAPAFLEVQFGDIVTDSFLHFSSPLPRAVKKLLFKYASLKPLEIICALRKIHFVSWLFLLWLRTWLCLAHVQVAFEFRSEQR